MQGLHTPHLCPTCTKGPVMGRTMQRAECDPLSSWLTADPAAGFLNLLLCSRPGWVVCPCPGRIGPLGHCHCAQLWAEAPGLGFLPLLGVPPEVEKETLPGLPVLGVNSAQEETAPEARDCGGGQEGWPPRGMGKTRPGSKQASEPVGP